MRHRVIHGWEVLGLLGAGALAAWQAVPGLVPALLAAGAGLLLPWRPGGRRLGPLALAAACVLGGAVGAATTWRVGRIESAWGNDTTGVRGALIDRASRRLASDLAGAVATARALADLAIAEADRDRLVGGHTLREAVSPFDCPLGQGQEPSEVR